MAVCRRMWGNALVRHDTGGHAGCGGPKSRGVGRVGGGVAPLSLADLQELFRARYQLASPLNG